MIFPKMRGGIYRKNRGKRRLALVYHGTLVLATRLEGWLLLVYPGKPMPAPSLSTTSSPRQHFLPFLDFWPYFWAAVWRPFRAPFSLNFICTEISRCLVSNGFCLIQFGAMVIEISCSEWRWRKVEKLWTSSLEKFISFNPKQMSLRPFGENWLRPCYSRWSNPFVPVLSQ